MNASEILEMPENNAVLTAYFIGIASCEFYDGQSYQLYFDAHDNSLFIHQEVSSNSRLSRADGSLHRIWTVSGYCDIPYAERYTDGCSLDDYGYSEWLGHMGDALSHTTE
jgi:hypothetical protein